MRPNAHSKAHYSHKSDTRVAKGVQEQEYEVSCLPVSDSSPFYCT